MCPTRTSRNIGPIPVFFSTRTLGLTAILAWVAGVER
jgi:hypothetical protein